MKNIDPETTNFYKITSDCKKGFGPRTEWNFGDMERSLW